VGSYATWGALLPAGKLKHARLFEALRFQSRTVPSSLPVANESSAGHMARDEVGAVWPWNERW
jgi:hypothetical protein